MESNKESDARGALIVLEGLDRCGKTSQCSRLLAYLEELGHSVESWRFPDRNTSSYLANKSHLDDHAIRLLFRANSWEKSFHPLRKGSYTEESESSLLFDFPLHQLRSVLDMNPLSDHCINSFPSLTASRLIVNVFIVLRKLPKEEVMEERGMGILNFRKMLLSHMDTL